MIVGLVLGVGIFRAPQLVAANSGSGTMFIGLWLLGGLVSLIGALCYAEIATAYPNTGVSTIFVSRVWAPDWLSVRLVADDGAANRLLAILAFVFGDFAAPLLPFGAGASPFLAAATVIVLTAVNVVGLRQARGRSTC